MYIFDIAFRVWKRLQWVLSIPSSESMSRERKAVGLTGNQRTSSITPVNVHILNIININVSKCNNIWSCGYKAGELFYFLFIKKKVGKPGIHKRFLVFLTGVENSVPTSVFVYSSNNR